MDQSLSYLHEVLSNYTEEIGAIRDIDEKITQNEYTSENLFSRDLDEEESRILREILLKEMHHANESGDHERGYQLHEVYELLY
ncbi:sporulation protein [Salinibacillus xinjiangensis]|uniref:Sporulation protein n=1 Tax=Salinibacillus xinjiangensis TaxID=1229268 RepID=A0A6G1X4E3_9BACI|nr:sporulation protein [Salinibacillus xinjiangensis]MRG85863.1 sporulation protein [Salinibacillus xinjiangensis]